MKSCILFFVESSGDIGILQGAQVKHFLGHPVQRRFEASIVSVKDAIVSKTDYLLFFVCPPLPSVASP